jgi:hypothetical protein
LISPVVQLEHWVKDEGESESVHGVYSFLSAPEGAVFSVVSIHCSVSRTDQAKSAPRRLKAGFLGRTIGFLLASLVLLGTEEFLFRRRK